jgi:hypothetical protein
MSETNPPSVPMTSPEYIMSLERKVIYLENQIQQHQNQMAQQTDRIISLENRIPNTSLLSPKFVTRAFTVWGHLWVAQLIIALPLYCIIFFLASLTGN